MKPQKHCNFIASINYTKIDVQRFTIAVWSERKSVLSLTSARGNARPCRVNGCELPIECTN